MKKVVLSCSIFILSISGYAQPEMTKLDKQFTVPEIGWTFNIPEGFVVVDSGTTINKIITGVDHWNKRFTFKNKADIFSFSISTYSNEDNTDWLKSYSKEIDRSYGILSKLKPLVNFDSSTSIVILNPVQFRKFSMIGSQNGAIVYNHIELKSFYKGYRLNIVYVFVDALVGKEIESQLGSSKFN